MILKKLLLVAVLAIAAQTAFSQNLGDNPIDKRLQARLDSSQNQTFTAKITCLGDAEKEWDAELGKYYKLLMGKLSEDGGRKLKESQLKWLAYRDAEFNTNSEIYGYLKGNKWWLIHEETETRIVKNRALELKAYYDNLNEGK